MVTQAGTSQGGGAEKLSPDLASWPLLFARWRARHDGLLSTLANRARIVFSGQGERLWWRRHQPRLGSQRPGDHRSATRRPRFHFCTAKTQRS